MNSVQKVYEALEELADADDEDVTEALKVPVPPMVLRSILPAVARSLPDDPGELDEFLTQVGNFCHSMRSDDYEPAVT